MTGEGTRKDTEQTPNPLNCQADALPIELQPHAREADGRKSVVPSLATPTSYNKHRPTQRVPTGPVHLATSPAPAARSIAPASKVIPMLSRRVGVQLSVSTQGSGS